MSRPYDDKEFHQLTFELREVITSLLDMEGNTKEVIQTEVENILGEVAE